MKPVHQTRRPQPELSRQQRRHPCLEYLEDRLYPGDVLAGYFVAGFGLLAAYCASGQAAVALPAPDWASDGFPDRAGSGSDHADVAVRPLLGSILSSPEVTIVGQNEQGRMVNDSSSARPSGMETDALARDFVSDWMSFWDALAPRPGSTRGQRSPASSDFGISLAVGGASAGPADAARSTGAGSMSESLPSDLARPRSGGTVSSADSPRWGPISLATASASLSSAESANVRSASPRSSPSVPPPGLSPAPHVLTNAPLQFEANVGQTDRSVHFLTHGHGYTAFLTSTDQVLVFSPQSTHSASLGATANPPDIVHLHLVGSNATVQPIGQDLLQTRTNYFIGNDPATWHTNIPNYGQVLYPSVYPGVDLLYHSSGDRQLEYDFVVAPGADPNVIEMQLQGAGDVTIDRAGELVVSNASTKLVEHAPGIYQDIDGVWQTVAGRYVLRGANQVHFQLGAYDHTRPLVIDPALSYSTYLGGSGDDEGQGIAVDGTGGVYVTGFTDSTDFPTSNPEQSNNNGGTYDVFVSKLNPAGAGLAYSTYLGGSRADYATAIAVDGAGDAYVTGYTGSTDFPTVNALQPKNDGGVHAFVTELSPAGNSLLYSTYLGGSNEDHGNGIAVDGSGYAYVTGYTKSTNFPTQNQYEGNGNVVAPTYYADAFVTKLDTTKAGSDSLLYSTYLGGSNTDIGTAIAVDGSGNAYVTGYTGSADFPTANAEQSSNAGSDDAFVTKIDTTQVGAASLIYSTYLGGSDYDQGNAIAIDSAGEAYVTGSTLSRDFPTVNALQSSHGGAATGSDYDAFVAKLSAAGNVLLYSTYLGGSSDDFGNGIAVDGFGHASVTGQTFSSDFPTQSPVQANFTGADDAFVVELDPSLSGAASGIYSTFLGGSQDDEAIPQPSDNWGQAIAVDGSGTVYITGTTSSTDFPLQGAFQPTFGGFYDCFVASIHP